MKKRIDFLNSHSRPTSRRQFVGLGLAQATSLLMLPSILGGMAKADEIVCPDGGSSLFPFILFDCVGGAGLAGNWLVGKESGAEDYLSSYDTLGISRNPKDGEPLDRQFGAPFLRNLSKVRAGILQTTTSDTRSRLRMGVICAATQDDTPTNPLSPVILISRAGLRGHHIHSGLGTMGTPSGGSSRSPLTDPTLKPLMVNKLEDVVDAISYGTIVNRLPVESRRAMAKTVSRLSLGQLKKFEGMRLYDQFRELAACGLIKNESYVTPPTGVDPRLDPIASSVFALDSATSTGDLAVSTLVYNVVKGNSGPGAIAIAGCDYHDGTQTTGDGKDLELGQKIGRAVELAARLKRPLVFAVVTDGSTYSDKGTRIWRGDSGSKGISVVGFFHPDRNPEMLRSQVGHFTDGQVVERKTYIGNDPKRVAYAITANYLNAQGKLKQFSSLVKAGEFDPKELDSHLVFA